MEDPVLRLADRAAVKDSDDNESFFVHSKLHSYKYRV